jgi:hypothetical protein
MGKASAGPSVALGSATAPRSDGAEVEAELSYSSKSDDMRFKKRNAMSASFEPGEL